MRELWTGTIKLLELEENGELIVRLDDSDFDLNELVFAFRIIKSKYGVNLAKGMIMGLIGLLEDLKLQIILLQDEILGDSQ